MLKPCQGQSCIIVWLKIAGFYEVVQLPSEHADRSKQVLASRMSAQQVLPFTKMQALGNDFVVVSEDNLKKAFPVSEQDWEGESSRAARLLCDRHFGVGADGLIVARSASGHSGQIGWHYVNSDGSGARICGNGLRCLALWAVERRLVEPPDFTIKTAIGAVPVHFASADEITIDLGEPILASSEIPMSGTVRNHVVKESLTAGPSIVEITCVSMGNPHCVIFNPAFAEENLAELAKTIQRLPAFPQGVNVEFAYTESRQRVRVLVWERGCGATLACASGAAAVLVAGVLQDLLDRSATVVIPGGSLIVDWSVRDNHVRLTGPARESFAGEVDLACLSAEVQLT